MSVDTTTQVESGVVTPGHRAIPVLPDTSNKRERRHAFIVDEKTNFDEIEVETPSGPISVTIPSVYLTFYWAVLRFMYANHSRPVSTDKLCEGVRQLMEEHAKAKWDHFISKSSVTTRVKVTRSKSESIKQPPKDWKTRLVSNARNLCRIGSKSPNSYGQRLLHRGHVLRYETDKNGDGYFILFLNLTDDNVAERKRGRKRTKLPGGPAAASS